MSLVIGFMTKFFLLLLLLLTFIFIFTDLVLPHFIYFYAFSGGGQTTSGSRFIAPSTVLEFFVCLFLMLY